MWLLTVGVSGKMVKVFHFTIGPTMNYIPQPWQLLLMILAGWVSREQQETIEYDINDSGQVVGAFTNASGQGRAFPYDFGTMTDLGALPGGNVADAWRINSSARWSVSREAQTAIPITTCVKNGPILEHSPRDDGSLLSASCSLVSQSNSACCSFSLLRCWRG